MNSMQTPGSGRMTAVQAGGGCCAPSSQSVHSPSGGSIGRLVPSWLGGRGLIIVAVAVVGLGMAFGWPTLVALGVAPLLLSFLPCAAMCALGLCMMGKGRRAGPAQVDARQVSAGDEAPTLLTADMQAAAPQGASAREPARLA